MRGRAWMSAIAAFPRLGHLQRQIRRLLLTHGPMTTPELAGHIYARAEIKALMAKHTVMDPVEVYIEVDGGS